MAGLARGRQLEPEWLDALPPADPLAVRSRADLRRINALMGNAAIVAQALKATLPGPPAHIVDLGAGDGAFLAQLAERLGADWRGVRAVLLDRQDTVTARSLARLSGCGWQPEIVTAPAAAWLAEQPAGTLDVVVANLFLHHFSEATLATLLRLLAAKARWVVACEPRRSAAAAVGSRLLGLLGCTAVTRHDARVSVRAGFTGHELGAPWPGRVVAEEPRRLFSHLFVARGLTR